MKHALANLLLNIARVVGGGDSRWEMGDSNESEDRRLKVGDGANKAASGLNHSFSPEVEAMLTAHPVWGVEEAKAVAAFLNSPAGQLFSRRIRSVAAHVAIEGANTGGTRCATTANTIHSAGVSAGWNECVRYIHSLATVAAPQAYQRAIISRVSGEQDIPRVGGSDSKDRHQPEDEAGLLERLSP